MERCAVALAVVGQLAHGRTAAEVAVGVAVDDVDRVGAIVHVVVVGRDDQVLTPLLLVGRGRLVPALGGIAALDHDGLAVAVDDGIALVVELWHEDVVVGAVLIVHEGVDGKVDGAQALV